MSGGGGGAADARGSRQISTRRYGSTVSVNTSAARAGIAAAPSPNAGRGVSGPSRSGESRIGEPNAVEPRAAVIPQSRGPSGFDTSTPVSDTAPDTQAAAVRRNRSRLARGGGLSNVRFGGATLG